MLPAEHSRPIVSKLMTHNFRSEGLFPVPGIILPWLPEQRFRFAGFGLRLVCLASLMAVLPAARVMAESWRKRLGPPPAIIDLHQHIASTPHHLDRALRIMDAANIRLAVNLSGGVVTRSGDQPSPFERNWQLAQKTAPDRFLLYFNLDYSNWDSPEWPGRAIQQVETAHRLGAAGLKEFKRLGLYLRDGAGKLITVDDPKLDGVWRRCGELGLPVSIHVADPRAFWLPYDERNERWKELRDHKPWWFGDPAKYPPREELLAALNRVIARHPQTTFVCVHFANNAEDLDWVEASLDRYPNMMADLAARVPELGRHDPERLRQLFHRHQDRIVFATDFQVHDRLILGSSGDEPPPGDEDALVFFLKYRRWLETRDRDWPHMTPIQGDWTIRSIGLSAEVLRKIYYDNARRILIRSMPLPAMTAKRIGRDFALDGALRHGSWRGAEEVLVDSTLREGIRRPEYRTTVRVLWSDHFLYLGYRAPFDRMTVFTPPEMKGERLGLWDRDVVEAFIASDPARPEVYTEFEVAPTGEKLDLTLTPDRKDFEWSSGFEAATRVDRRGGVWTCEMRIPLAALSSKPPRAGDRWRLNLYRHQAATRTFLAWSPTATRTAHTPHRFGWLRFGEE
ncbi:MAG: hypothetical protein FJ404_15695 [Verrucomicrobia bacterium]|nr:hypothetical protein [Verrucomicrobiota bacterium]